ncbi:MAG: hypothetical protein PHN88_07380 [Ignavibacteria bacterium]|nr:hypothetical protein [Ignavibacteria bacterium]
MNTNVWEDTEIEKLTFAQLKKENGDKNGDSIITDYKDARNKVVEYIIHHIPKAEKSLTDHTETHIVNVLNNAYRLIDGNSHEFNSAELYLLCLCILFHDAGNIKGRTEHTKTKVIQEIYEFVRDTKKFPKFKQEKVILSKIVYTHSGKSSENKNNPNDRISELLNVTFSGLHDKSINYVEIAAILRFADELAEGPQRISSYLISNNIIEDAESIKHHLNSYSVHYGIHKVDRRIIVNYHIPTQIDEKVLSNEEIKSLLSFTFERIKKLNKERIYCRYYSRILSDFNKISIQYYLTVNDNEEQLSINPLELSDLTFEALDIAKINEDYELDNLINLISNLTKSKIDE